VHKIVQATAAAGAIVNAGGTYERLFYRSTALSGVQPGMPAYDEEIFGPVCSVIPFDDDEAVRLANDSDYGLSAAIVSRSVQRALALGNRLNTGLPAYQRSNH
jgi:benzaldehyde dehydrogenase (NAD)